MKINMVFFIAGVLLNLIVASITFFHAVIHQRATGKTNTEIDISENTAKIFGLSQREKEIAMAVLQGKTNSEIAQEKFIAVTTVKKHVYNLFNKTNARNRIELINRLRSQT